MAKFVNPYNFIPIGSKKSENAGKGELSGVIHYSVLTKTPLFIPNTSCDATFETSLEEKEHISYDFYSYHNQHPAEKGKKVLVIDMDPQGNTSSGLGIDKDELDTTVYQLMIGDNTFEECVQKEVFENLDVLAANVNLAGIEIETMDMEDRNYILHDIIEKIKEEYDYIIIDCPPSLNALTINAMTTADSVLVPIQCEYYALEGLSQLIYTIDLVRERLNPKLVINGVVFTMYDVRTNLSMQVIENVRNNLNQTIYDTIIPRGVRLAEAPSHGLPITKYDRRSAGAQAYLALADEVIERSR